MRAAARALRLRAAAVAAVAALVAVTAGCASALTAAWVGGVPLAVRHDLAASPDNAVTVARILAGNGSGPAGDASFRQADTLVRSVAAANGFQTEAIELSEPYDLSGPQNGASHTQTVVVAGPRVREQAVLVAGTWPDTAPDGSPASTPGPISTSPAPTSAPAPATPAPIPVAGPAPALQSLGLSVGSVLTVRGTRSHAATALRIVGAFALRTDEPAEQSWNPVGPSGMRSTGSFITYGPFVAAPRVFEDGRLTGAQGTFVLRPADANLARIPGRVAAVASALPQSAGFSAGTALPALIRALTVRAAAARAQLLIVTILMSVLAGMALAAATGNLAVRGAAQSALLDARGAPRRELMARHLLDLVVFGAAGVLGPAVVRAGSGRLGLGADMGGPAWAAAAGVAGAAGIVVLARVARPPRPAAAVGAAGREQAVPASVRAGVDVVLVVAAVLALWQASTIGLATGAGPVLLAAAAPALATLAGAVMTGRLVAGAARLAEHAAGRARRLPVHLAALELARTPVRHLTPALLCVAAVAGCGYCAAEHQSWTRSVGDQASFQNGAQVAVRPTAPLALTGAATVVSAPGVVAATPVETIGEGDHTLVAVDAGAAGAIALRPDLLGSGGSALWARIRADPAPALAGHPHRLHITGSVDGASQGTTVAVTATIEDATGVAYQVPLGKLAADGAPHTVGAELAGSVEYPLRVVGVVGSLEEPQETTMHLTSLGADTGDLDVRSWRYDATRTSVHRPTFTTDSNGAVEQSMTTVTGVSRFTFAPKTTPAEVPVLATASYLAGTGSAVGSGGRETVDGATVAVRVVGVLAAFPGTSSALIGDTATLDAAVAAAGVDPAVADTWWLRTATGAPPTGLPADAAVSTIAELRAAALADPLSGLPQRLVAAGAPVLVLLAALGLVAAMAAASDGAAYRDTVLAGLGTTRSQTAGLSCVLHCAVAVPAAGLGIGLGALVAALLVPHTVLAPDGGPPLPSALVRFAIPPDLGAALAVVAVVAVAAAGAALRRGEALTVMRKGR